MLDSPETQCCKGIPTLSGLCIDQISKLLEDSFTLQACRCYEGPQTPPSQFPGTVSKLPARGPLWKS